MRVEIVKIIPNARTSYNFGCLEESDEKHFSWQAQRIVDLKVGKDNFAVQAQGFVKVTTFASQLHWDLQSQSWVLEVLNRAYIGICDAECYPEVRFCEKSRGKCSFWRLGFSLLVKVSWNMLVLEARILTFGEVSRKMLVLEAWILTFGDSLLENALEA